MSLFKILWLRRLIRRHTKPIPEPTAEVWKRRLSMIYMICAWNAFGVVIYACFSGRADWAKYHGLPQPEGTPAQQWTHTLGLKNVQVLKVSGANVDKYQVLNEFDKKGNVLSSEIIREDKKTNEDLTEHNVTD